MTPKLIRVNLISIEKKAPIPAAYKHFAGAVVSLLVCLGAVAYVWIQTENYYNEKKDEAAKKEKISNELEQYMKQVNVFKKTKSDLEDKLDTIAKLKDSQKGPLRLFTEYRNKFTPQIWTTSFVYKKDIVTIKGYGLSLTTIGDFVEALQSSKYFSSVDYMKSGIATVDGVKVYNFDIKFRFDADPERTKREQEQKNKAAAEKKRLEAEKKKAALEKKQQQQQQKKKAS